MIFVSLKRDTHENEDTLLCLLNNDINPKMSPTRLQSLLIHITLFLLYMCLSRNCSQTARIILIKLFVCLWVGLWMRQLNPVGGTAIGFWDFFIFWRFKKIKYCPRTYNAKISPSITQRSRRTTSAGTTKGSHKYM